MSDSVALVLHPERGKQWERERLLMLVSAVCELIGQGMTKDEACERVGLSRTTYWRAISKDAECWALHVRARMDQTHSLADEVLRMARTPSGTLVEAQDKRTYLDTVKWLCAKVHPRAYGDPRQLEMTGTDGQLVERAQQWQIGKRSIKF